MSGKDRGLVGANGHAVSAALAGGGIDDDFVQCLRQETGVERTGVDTAQTAAAQAVAHKGGGAGGLDAGVGQNAQSTLRRGACSGDGIRNRTGGKAQTTGENTLFERIHGAPLEIGFSKKTVCVRSGPVSRGQRRREAGFDAG